MDRRRALVNTDAATLLAASQAAGRSGQHREGARMAQESAARAERAGDPQQAALAMAALSLHQLRLGDCEASIEAGRQALRQLTRNGDALAQSQVHSTLSLAFFNTGLNKECLAHAIDALDTARASGNGVAQCWALNRMGMAHEGVADIETGLDYLHQAHQLALQLSDAEVIFPTLNNLARGSVHLAEMLKERDQDPAPTLQKALGSYEAALAAAKETGNRAYIAMSLAGLGNVLGLLGRSDEAVACLDRAMRLAVADGFRSVEQDAAGHLAERLRQRGNLPAACAELQTQLARDEGSTVTKFTVRAHRLLYEMLKAQGHFEKALAHHELFYTLERREREARADLQSRILIHRAELDQAKAAVESAGLEATQQRKRAEELDRIANLDALTGVYNRRYIDLHLPALAAKAQAQRMPLSIGLLDIDHFKLVNDRHGHAVGDFVLAQVAQLLRRNARESDLTVRQGGEEFLVVFIDTPLAQAAQTCERLRLAVQDHDWAAIQPGLAVTVSLGLSARQGGEALGPWFIRTDAALYQAKRAGRNRVVQAT